MSKLPNKAYKWNTGSPSINVTVSNIAADNSGITKLELVDSTGGLTITYNSGGVNTADSTKSYTSNFLVSASAITNGYATQSFKTKVTWKNGGTTTNSTVQTAYLCQPATSMTVSLGSTSIWSNGGRIGVNRTFHGSTSAIWAPNGMVVFTSGDPSYVTVGTSDAITETTAVPANLTSKIINRTKDITITGTSTAGEPDYIQDVAAPNELTGTAKLTIKNATNSLALGFNDAHLYKGQQATATVTSTPHANGAGSVVYSNELTSISSDKTAVATVSSATKASNNTNSNTFTVTGKGGGVAKITVSSTADKVGKAVSASAQIICSSLDAVKYTYTYREGTGTIPVSYDSISSHSNSALVNAATTSTNTTAGTLTYTGKTSGTNTVTMASGAKLYFVCSVLYGTQTINLVSSTNSGTTRTIDISNDAVSSVSNSYISYTVSGNNLSVTAKGGGTRSSVINMRSGAVINVNIVAGEVGDSDVRLNAGDSKSVSFNANDGIKTSDAGQVFTYTVSANTNTIKISAIKAGKGSITMNSGLTINITVTDITVDIS